jgi:hypothetical protein
VDVVDDEDGFATTRDAGGIVSDHKVLVVVSLMWKAHMKSKVSSKNEL